MDSSPPKTRPTAHRLLADLVAWLVLSAAFAAFAWRSWRTWPDLLVDFGAELYVPWRIAEGEVLYRDIAFAMGPLSQHVHALLFRCFGVSLTTIIFANLLILAGVVAMLYALFRRCGTAWSAMCVLLFFLAVQAFAQYSLIGNYNYVCPYRHEVTHGLALGLAEILCLLRFAEAGRFRWLLLGGLCLGMIGLTKLEMLLPAVVTTGAAFALIFRRGGSAPGRDGPTADAARSNLVKSGHRQLPAQCVYLAVAAAVPVAGAGLGLAWRGGWSVAMDGLLVNFRYALDPALTIRSGFYQAVSGRNNPEENLVLVLLAAATVLVTVGLGVVVALLLSRFKQTKVLSIMVGAGAAFGALFMIPPSEWSSLPLALPVLVSLVAITTGLINLRSESAPAGMVALFLISVYGLFLLPKILLAVGWSHYGFALAMPGTLVMIHVLVREIPRWLDRKALGAGAHFRALAIGLLSACALVQFVQWDRIDQAKNLAIGAGGDRFFADPQFDVRATPVAQTLSWLSGAMKPDETLAVVPEGVMLNYQLRRRNPTGFILLNPWEFDAHGGEDRIAEAFARSNPDYIVLLTMDTSDHGRGNFGNPQFGKKVLEFILGNYHVVDSRRTNSMNDELLFQSLVFQRNVAPDKPKDSPN